MIKEDYHIHSIYCDGKDKLEDIVLSAIDKKMDKIGLLFHSYVYFDKESCIKEEKIKDFIDEVNYLKEKYKDKIDIKIGVEQDYFSDNYDYNFDYIIGSVHYVKKNNEYISVDDTYSILENGIKNYYDNDVYKLVKDYFDLEKDIVRKTKCDIIGHFDLISKFNLKYKFFDENDKRYIDCFKDAINELIKYDCVFEINTGGIKRGYKNSPYPSFDIINYIKSKKGKFILSSDSHNKDDLMFEFDKYMEYI